MSDDPSSHEAADASNGLAARLEALGRELGSREASHEKGLAEARACAEALRGRVAEALDRFHAAASAAGAPHLRIALSEVRADDKHLRAVEFDLARGRHRAIVVAKSRGELTLVGPFRAGKAEGPGEAEPSGPRRRHWADWAGAGALGVAGSVYLGAAVYESLNAGCERRDADGGCVREVKPEPNKWLYAGGLWVLAGAVAWIAPVGWSLSASDTHASVQYSGSF